MQEELKNIITKIEKLNGRCLLVGGGVIDKIIGIPVKDWDIEVYGLSYEELLNVLSEFGKPNLVGKSFGIIKIRINDTEYDFSVPRIENKTGVGHKGFKIELKPHLTPKEAARRRDITINSMYTDLHTGELIDPYNGFNDLQNGIIRATCPETFVEEPLRVLRIMQILPRKGKTVEKETIELCRNIAHEFKYLAKERIFEEFKKLLLKAKKPSLGLQFLVDCGWIEFFPELNALIGCPQNPQWHPEGDVWNHTLLAIDYAAEIRDKLDKEWQLAFMFGVLLHDTGKPATTDLKTLKAHGHDKAGEQAARQFLKRITNDISLTEKVLRIVSLHMRPQSLLKNNAKISAWKRLHNKLPLDILGWHCYVDKKACTLNPEEIIIKLSEACFSYFEEFGKEPIKPILMGKHLIEAGYQPGPKFKQMLDKAFDYQIETGESDTEKLIRVATGSTPISS